jgi:hypothetical protein
MVLMTMVPSVCGGVLNHITGAKALVLKPAMGNSLLEQQDSLQWVSLQKLSNLFAHKKPGRVHQCFLMHTTFELLME